MRQKSLHLEGYTLHFFMFYLYWDKFRFSDACFQYMALTDGANLPPTVSVHCVLYFPGIRSEKQLEILLFPSLKKASDLKICRFLWKAGKGKTKQSFSRNNKKGCKCVLLRFT